MQTIRFQFTYEQARAVVLSRTGLGGLLWPVLLTPFLLLAVTEAIHMLGGPFPTITGNPTVFGSYTIWLIFIGTMLILIDRWSRKLTEKHNRVDFSDDIVILQNEGGTALRIHLCDISRVDIGKRVARLDTRFGTYFLPAPLVPGDYLHRLEEQLNTNYRRRIWM